jgi:tmRNA-binding protein
MRTTASIIVIILISAINCDGLTFESKQIKTYFIRITEHLAKCSRVFFKATHVKLLIYLNKNFFFFQIWVNHSKHRSEKTAEKSKRNRKILVISELVVARHVIHRFIHIVTKKSFTMHAAAIYFNNPSVNTMTALISTQIHVKSIN